MKYVAAYMLCVMGGHAKPSASDIEKVLGSVGIQTESDKVNKVLELLNGKDLEALIAEGKEKLAAIPSGGGVAPSAVAVVTEEKVEEKKEEPKDDSDDEMEGGMGGLFD